MKLATSSLALSVALLIGFFTSPGQGQQACPKHDTFDFDDDGTLTVDAKTVLERPACYEGKFLRVIGFYQRGFETSQLFCLDCSPNAAAWMDWQRFTTVIKRCTLPDDFKQINGGGEFATFGIVVLGVVETNLTANETPPDIGSKRLSDIRARPGFGHMNAYDTEFSPICFERVEKFKNDYMDAASPKAAKVREQMKKWHDKAVADY